MNAWVSLLLRHALAGLLAMLPLRAQTLVLACEDKTDFPNVLGEGQDLDARLPGASVEFVKLLGAELGVQVVIRRLPWRRAMELELKSGAVDGLFPASYRQEREAYGLYPLRDGTVDDARCMFVSTYSFYKPKGSILEWDGLRLRNLAGPIGASRGYSVVEDLRRQGYEVQESDEPRKDLLRLASGRLAAVAGLESGQDFLLAESPELGASIVKMQPPISTKHYFLMLSRPFVQRNPALARQIWDKCRELRERALPKILKKYLRPGSVPPP